MTPPSNSPPGSPESALRLPASKRVSAPSSVRLSTILEGQARGRRPSGDDAGPPPHTPPPLPTRSPWRVLAYTANPRSAWSSTASSIHTAPPAYEWVSNPDESSRDPRHPVEGEKVAALRRGEQPKRRGGWKRLLIILALVLLVVIGLAVGLGVGLTVGRKSNNKSSTSSSTGYGNTPESSITQSFPLGEYSMVTNLRTVSTGCTSNAATWRCAPYTVYDPSDSSSFGSSAAVFNWILTNTSDVYASNRTTTVTSATGIPANLTISSTDNPFSITFVNETLTYHATADNSSSAYYAFSFIMSKTVYPTTSLTSNNVATECLYNQTTFAAKLYLSASTADSSAQANSSAAGGYTPWPYALQISQSSPSGSDVPACYSLVNGDAGDRITTGVSPVTDGGDCTCEYRNY